MGPPPIQKTLALAEEFRRQLDAGGVNQADLARLYGRTRARVTQLLHPLKLHPVILDSLRALPPGPHARLFTERRVRPLLALSQQTQLDAAGGVLIGCDQHRVWLERASHLDQACRARDAE